MAQLYELTTAGTIPVTLVETKAYLKVDASTDDALITSMINAATLFGEKYTGRDFRVNTWTMRQNDFDPRMCLRRSTIATITSIKYRVATVETEVASSVYYLKNSHEFGEALLLADQEWPTDGDFGTEGIEGTVVTIFVTAIPKSIEQIRVALFRHIAALYQNRGDCGLKASVSSSGANLLYDPIRISRI